MFCLKLFRWENYKKKKKWENCQMIVRDGSLFGRVDFAWIGTEDGCSTWFGLEFGHTERWLILFLFLFLRRAAAAASATARLKRVPAVDAILSRLFEILLPFFVGRMLFFLFDFTFAFTFTFFHITGLQLLTSSFHIGKQLQIKWGNVKTVCLAMVKCLDLLS